MNIVIKPTITEKSFQEAEKGKYTFVVEEKARKPQIKSAVERMFGVHVRKVFTGNMKGARTRRTKFSKEGKMIYKKARVLLLKGEKIVLFEEKAK